MTLYSHYAVSALANTYLIVPPEPNQAILIDPVVLDVALFRLIEENGYYVRTLLFTKPMQMRARGVATIRKVFDVTILAPSTDNAPYEYTPVRAGDALRCGGVTARAISARDTAGEGILYDIESHLFSGTWLGAGVIGTAPLEQIRTSIRYELVGALSGYPDLTPVLPYQGPPTSLGVERESSPAFSDYSEPEA